MKELKIFIVDDERILRVTIADGLRDEGYTVFEFSSGAGALQQFLEEKPDVVITDMRMPGMDGLELLARINQLSPQTEVILMTAYASVSTAVKALKAGAYDYLTKPFQIEELLAILRRICELKKVKSENKRLRSQFEQKFDFSSFVGSPEENASLFELIRIAAGSDSNVLITGETGTGKELLTKIIHYNSSRKDQAFVPVSCAVLSREVFESELFGHVKGAFTGAEKEREGRFQLANHGTLYLDDIDDIPIELQVKLLRAIEERKVEKVGGSKPEPVDIRIIASTKTDIGKLVQEGKFRPDLYFRLNVFPIHLPPLRERKRDVKILIHYFVNYFAHGRKVEFDVDAFNSLLSYNWPGNIRELKNIIERFVLLAQNGKIDITKIPQEICNPVSIPFTQLIGHKPLVDILSEVEISTIKIALERSKHNKTKAAEILGIPATTLHTKMSKYNID
ncbi:Response regulator of zinc sigma-54-dependent two-component system [hydrothermal vent metagenome]|uniref:Response regulator of zinc sigma-54-dependent two-component system n=1 Tax=hydrothermal vent metagenome TaxID=652676 RepID=A0A3B0UJN9_9ZZZZ